MTDLKRGLPPLPRRIARLPVDDRGYPIPWFVATVDGQRDFRVADAEKRVRAVQDGICWVCGDYLGVYKAFVIGPMCAVNRVTSEPPCHQDCAEFSAIACPWLSRPQQLRRTNDLPEDRQASAGIALDRNPGVTCIWTTGKFRPFRVPAGIPGAGPGWLISLGDPVGVKWYARGREATRAEVEASIESGLPALLDPATEQGPEAVASLMEAREAAARFYPLVQVGTV